MHVPDSITVGPNRSNVSRVHYDDNRIPVRMEVPDRLRPGKSFDVFLSFVFHMTIYDTLYRRQWKYDYVE
jgi:hypothetical protein